MHIPDGFLDVKTALVTSGIAAIGVAFAINSSKKVLLPREIPLIGVSAAFIFSAQMLNFPVVGGTSGHLTGACLLAILLGPVSAILTLTTVLLLQCFMFADGGITTLGANVLNMSIIASLTGYLVYGALISFSKNGKSWIAAGVASWCSVISASVACAIELSLSGTVPWKIVFPAMTGIHALIGIGEAIITILVLKILWRSSPGLLPNIAEDIRPKVLVRYSLIASFMLAIFVSPFASEWPDGLETVAEVLAFDNTASNETLFKSPLTDYIVPGIKSEILSTISAAVIGTLMAFIMAVAILKILRPKVIKD